VAVSIAREVSGGNLLPSPALPKPRNAASIPPPIAGLRHAILHVIGMVRADSGRSETLDVDAVKSAKKVAGMIGQSLVELELDAKRIPESLLGYKSRADKPPIDHVHYGTPANDDVGGKHPVIEIGGDPAAGRAPFVAAMPRQAPPAAVDALTQRMLYFYPWIYKQPPNDVADKLRALMRRLGLVYGAIDLRLTEDGRYVFLEINPAGQFLYVEQQTGQPSSLVYCWGSLPRVARPSIAALDPGESGEKAMQR
jgi:hypothetical protein